MLVVAVVVGGGAFYGGMKYGQSNPPAGGQDAGKGFANLSPEERQARLPQFGAGGQRGARSGGGFVNGEIIAKDDPALEQVQYGAGKSLTVKLRDGGSKIVFYSDSTEVGKFVTSTPADLEIGQTVSVNGQASQDGSLTAQSIQIRPQ